MSFVLKAKKYYRFASGFRKFLKGTISLEESKAIIKKRMQNRESLFLRIIEKGIYQNKSSPYLELLQLANYEFEDIKKLVARVGIEETLQHLREDGVYISYEEFKAKKEAIRGGQVFRFKEEDFDNPYLSHYYEVRSGGTRSAGTRTMIDFNFLCDRAPHFAIIFDVNDVLDDLVAIYSPILPVSAGINLMLMCAKIGKTPTKWFSMVEKERRDIPLKTRLWTDYTTYMGRLFGAKLPLPEFVALNDTHKIVEWVTDMKKNSLNCALLVAPSSAVRICAAAKERELDIRGTKIFVGGEPLSQAKYREIQSVGANAIPAYAFTETGIVGCGCPNRTTVDDVHFFKDFVALIQHKRKIEHADIEVNSFLFTSLLPSAPKILLNVEIDDYGIMEIRKCGCGFDEVGFFDHICNIRSYGKLTGEGVTLVGTDFTQIIEEVLPGRFGGASTDYQFLEEEDEKGLTRLSILVSPKIGEIEEKDVLNTLFQELRARGHDRGFLPEIWAQANTMRVKRMNPVPTKSGKIFAFHLVKKQKEGRGNE